MLPAMESKDRLDLLAHYRSIGCPLTNARPGTDLVRKKCLKMLQVTDKAKTMLKTIVGHVNPVSTPAKHALFVLSA